MPLSFAIAGDGLGALLEEIERFPTPLYIIDISDRMNLQLKKGIVFSACHHSSVTTTVSS